MVLSSARFWFLCVAAERFPQILDDLTTRNADAPSMAAWGQRWHLTADWCLAQAQYSLQEHRAGSFDLKRHGWGDACDTPAGWAGESRTNPQHKDPEHFEWLARMILDPAETYGGIADEYGRTPQSVQQACAALARMIGLPFARRKGRPPRRSRNPVS